MKQLLESSLFQNGIHIFTLFLNMKCFCVEHDAKNSPMLNQLTLPSHEHVLILNAVTKPEVQELSSNIILTSEFLR